MADGPTPNPRYLKPGELDDSSIISRDTIMKRVFDPGKDKLRVDLDSDIQIGAVEIKDHNSDLRADVLTRDDGINALAVDIRGDIQIGAVELKDGNTDTRVDVENVGSYNAVMAMDVVNYQKQKINIFGSSLVAPGVTVTLATYTVPVGKTFTYSGGIVGGKSMGSFEFVINSITNALVRNSGSNPTIQVKFIEPPEASGNSIIDLRVTNDGDLARQFEATLSGFII